MAQWSVTKERKIVHNQRWEEQYPIVQCVTRHALRQENGVLKQRNAQFSLRLIFIVIPEKGKWLAFVISLVFFGNLLAFTYQA